MELFDIISNDIKEAMKAKDKVALDTLRNIKKVLLEAKTAPGAGDTVSDETAIKIIQKLVKQGKEGGRDPSFHVHFLLNSFKKGLFAISSERVVFPS